MSKITKSLIAGLVITFLVTVIGTIIYLLTNHFIYFYNSDAMATLIGTIWFLILMLIFSISINIYFWIDERSKNGRKSN